MALEIQEKVIFEEVKKILQEARNKIYKTANNAMVEAYWNIGRIIVEKQSGNEKAEYGAALLKNLYSQVILKILKHKGLLLYLQVYFF